jgi:3D (Asp-Asp-Asp) domain-containing protein
MSRASTRIRLLVVAAALLLGSLGAASPASAAFANPFVYADETHRFVWRAKAQRVKARPRAGAAAIRRRQWLSRVWITEYYPAPERWALGITVRTPGLSRRSRIDWLYGALGLSMQGTGIGTDGRYYHIDRLGRGAWVNRNGRPTYDGRNNNGPPYWRSGGFWRNSRGGVTFIRLANRAWTNGTGRRWVPPPAGISFTSGPGVRGLVPYGTIAVDPYLIPLGSRVYIPFYKNNRLSRTGWFRAIDTGGAIIGRHIDVFRPIPEIVDDLGRSLRNQRIYVIPPGG